ncbi:MAG: exodeoxyribonuclease VII small subunit [Bacilli bacterium]
MEINKELTFEQKLSRLEEILETVQSEEIGLEEMMKLYKEGKIIIAEVSDELEKAKDITVKVVK